MNRRTVLFSISALALTGTLFAGAVPAPAAPPTATLPPVGADFLWGVASSGFQTEGHAPDSNWTRYIAAGQTADPYQDSVDFFDRYASDIALAQQLGVRTYRISIEWARIQPSPGVWDERGLKFYDDVVGAIVAAGMRPMLTIDHWVYPGWEAGRGGWRNDAMVSDWLANARTVVDRYARFDPMWVTFNEPAMYIYQEFTHGGIGLTDAPVMADRITQAHNAIYDYIHRVQPGAMVTSNDAYIPVVDGVLALPVLDRIADRLDYIGIDYYYGLSIGAITPPDFTQPWRNPLQPEGIYYALREYSKRFPGRPLYVVENGMPTDNGRPRTDGYTRAASLRDIVYWVQRAKADGMNIIGYNYWSITDNYEWGSYSPRFGLYTVDVLTDPALTRRPTDAVAAYTDITRAGGVAPDYRPSRAPAPCSLVAPPSSCGDPVTVPH
ncbi:family 1 glycosylhydrolase [Nocardia sp. NPDC052001]|uniref:family 1 glycosylhydrolase n=1 Tax=Nocardia sp. NPDC052001 TaxID=3154853 RepID=UPI003436DCA3